MHTSDSLFGYSLRPHFTSSVNISNIFMVDMDGPGGNQNEVVAVNLLERWRIATAVCYGLDSGRDASSASDEGVDDAHTFAEGHCGAVLVVEYWAAQCGTYEGTRKFMVHDSSWCLRQNNFELGSGRFSESPARLIQRGNTYPLSGVKVTPDFAPQVVTKN